MRKFAYLSFGILATSAFAQQAPAPSSWVKFPDPVQNGVAQNQCEKDRQTQAQSIIQLQQLVEKEHNESIYFNRSLLEAVSNRVKMDPNLAPIRQYADALERNRQECLGTAQFRDQLLGLRAQMEGAVVLALKDLGQIKNASDCKVRQSEPLVNSQSQAADSSRGSWQKRENRKVVPPSIYQVPEGDNPFSFHLVCNPGGIGEETIELKYHSYDSAMNVRGPSLIVRRTSHKDLVNPSLTPSASEEGKLRVDVPVMSVLRIQPTSYEMNSQKIPCHMPQSPYPVLPVAPYNPNQLQGGIPAQAPVQINGVWQSVFPTMLTAPYGGIMQDVGPTNRLQPVDPRAYVVPGNVQSAPVNPQMAQAVYSQDRVIYETQGNFELVNPSDKERPILYQRNLAVGSVQPGMTNFPEVIRQERETLFGRMSPPVSCVVPQVIAPQGAPAVGEKPSAAPAPVVPAPRLPQRNNEEEFPTIQMSEGKRKSGDPEAIPASTTNLGFSQSRVAKDL